MFRNMVAWILRGKITRPAAEDQTRTTRSTNTTVTRNSHPAHWVIRPPYRSPRSWRPTVTVTATITPNRGRCTGRRRPTTARAAVGDTTITPCTGARLLRPWITITTRTTGRPARTRCPGPRNSHPITTGTTRTGRPAGSHSISTSPPLAAPLRVTNFNRTFTSCRPRESIPEKWSGCTWTITPTLGNDNVHSPPPPPVLFFFRL